MEVFNKIFKRDKKDKKEKEKDDKKPNNEVVNEKKPQDDKKVDKKDEKKDYLFRREEPTPTSENKPVVEVPLSEHEKSVETLSRYLTHLSTDKPIYRPGDTVYIRGTILHGFNRKPYLKNVKSLLQIIAPAGDTSFEINVNDTADSTVSCFWKIPQEQAGGDYKIKLSFPKYNGFATAEREFNIRSFRNPRLKTQLTFLKKGYGAGEDASASLEVKRAEGGVPDNAEVEAIARVDGKEVYRGPVTLDEEGNAIVKFKLPETITTGDGTLLCSIKDGGVVETASKTIPILLQTMDVRIYAEGGDLIANKTKNRFYVEAFTRSGDPADIVADIIQISDGRKVGEISTEHEGRGRSSFVPEPNQKYELKIVKPSGIINSIPFPDVKSEGVSLSSTKDVYAFEDDVEIEIAASTDSDYVVGLYKRDKEVSTKDIKLKANEVQSVKLPTLNADGVLRVTISKSNIPVTERIVYKKPRGSLNIELKADKTSYAPAGSVTLNVKTTDSNGRPVSAFVGVTVTDDSVLEMVEKRKQAPRLPVMALLENEVEHLEDAQFYFNPKESNSDLSIDLLLGTQGWRRFVYKDTSKLKLDSPEVAERLLVEHESTEPNYDDYPVPQMLGGGMNNDFIMPMMNMVQMNMVQPLMMMDDMMLEQKGSPMIEEENTQMIQPMPEMEMVMEKEKGPVLSPPPRDMAPPPPPPQMQQQQQALAPPPPMPPMQAQGPPPPMPMQAQKLQRQDLAPQRNMAMKKKEVKAKEQKKKKMPEKKKMMMKEEAEEDMCMDEAEMHPDFSEDEEDWVERIKPVVYQEIVREYAHKAPYRSSPDERTDFTETLYWNACVHTGADGTAVVRFDLNHSISSFKAIADGYSRNALLGTFDVLIESKEPFYIEPKMPLEVSSGDTIKLPIALVNATDKTLSGQLTFDFGGKGLERVDNKDVKFDLVKEKRERNFIELIVKDAPENNASLTISGKSSGYSDKVKRSTKVVPRGFPYEACSSGVLEANSKITRKFTIPDNVIPNSFETSVKFYTNPSGNLTQALESLIRTPCGCFEQTSMTTYPLVMALQYFKSHEGTDPKLIERSNSNLEKGYKALAGYECKNGGFEWFGEDPGHEALTAYGLMQFNDMSVVFPVDQSMVDRTKTWLLSRRDPAGGFQRNSRALDNFGGAPAEHTNAYITWALTNAGIDTKIDIDFCLKSYKGTKDAYVIGLLADCLFKAGRKDEAKEFAEKLVKLQKENGSITDEETSITRSSGDGLIVESTSIALLSFMNDYTAYLQPVDNGIKFLNSKCRNGNFGSTQATLLALKAIVYYDKITAGPSKEGSINVKLNGVEVTSIGFDKKPTDLISAESFADKLTAGPQTLELEMLEGSRLPFSVAIGYYAVSGDNSKDCTVDLSTNIINSTVKEGEGTEIEVKLKNKTSKSLPMTVAIIGLPGGLEPRHEKLKEMKKAGVYDFYETRGRDIVFYWRYIAEDATKTFKVDVLASVPGKYTGPASRAYLYYTDEHRIWNDGLKVQIDSK